MTDKQFDAILKARTEKMWAVLASKAKEYASTADRLHNFKQAAALMRCGPAHACGAFMTKHLVSVFDLIEKHERGEAIPSAVIDEKIGDAANYLVLLEAVFREAR